MIVPRPRLWITALLALAGVLLPQAAWAQVTVSFHSVNGSLLGNRFPHTFVVFEGRLGSGEVVSENFGYSAKTISPAILAGPVTHMIYIEKPNYIRRTNRHFAITVPEATYHRMKSEVAAWRDAPGPQYRLDSNNCIHFVGRIAELGGLRVDFPRELLRKPKAWLNHVSTLNPQIAARQF